MQNSMKPMNGELPCKICMWGLPENNENTCKACQELFNDTREQTIFLMLPRFFSFSAFKDVAEYFADNNIRKRLLQIYQEFEQVVKKAQEEYKE